MVPIHTRRGRIAVFLILVALASGVMMFRVVDLTGEDTWCGLVVAPEHRCSPYNSHDYAYPKSVKAGIVADLGVIYSPYTEQVFASTRQTDIEHIVDRTGRPKLRRRSAVVYDISRFAECHAIWRGRCAPPLG